MDFSITEDQQALANLAAQIFADHTPLERLKTVERSPDRYDTALWAEIAKAGLLGAALPEDAGGSGGGFLEMCLILEQQGKKLPLLPLVPTIIGGAMPLARFGSAAQQKKYLPGVVQGQTLLTAALSELGSDARDPQAVASKNGNAWRLNGTKVCVPWAHRAAAVLVPARTAAGEIGIFLVDPKGPGVSLLQQEPFNWEAQFHMELNNVNVAADAVLGPLDKAGSVLNWIVDRVTVGYCAIASGACAEALRLTAEYATNRKQFDKPIAMFQAVGQRMADGFIDNEAVSVTMWQAASRLDVETPSDKQIEVAKYWAAEGGSRIGHTGLHIHGGISIDIDYPIHRYFLWLKQIEYTLGSATPNLVSLGARIAAEPA